MSIIKKVQETANHAVFRTLNIGMNLTFTTLPPMRREPRVVRGKGCIREIPGVLKQLKVTHVLIVSGPSVGRTQVPAIRTALEANGIKVSHFDQVEPNPSVQNVESIYQCYANNGCNGFLAVGGGSPMDATKVAAARAAKPKVPVEKMGGAFKVLAKLPPIVCVPTTAGTGSEVTMISLISKHEEERKFYVADPSIRPLYAILDPELTVSMPPKLTATTGIDALSHAMEAYLAWNYNTDYSIRYAEDAIVKVFRYLERAYKDGNDMEAREQMLEASFQAGLAINVGQVGYVHAISHSIGGVYNSAHGLTIAVVMPYVLEEYGSAVWKKLAHLAEITGIKDSGTEEQKAKAFIQAIRDLNQRIGIPSKLDFMKAKDLDSIADRAVKEAASAYSVPVIFDNTRARHILNRIMLGV